jgi:DNA helicase-2/ATP-dependent DNA helicase PcrA
MKDTNDEELITRRENVLEFVGAVKEFEEQHEGATLEAFLENVALVTELDRQEDSRRSLLRL